MSAGTIQPWVDNYIRTHNPLGREALDEEARHALAGLYKDRACIYPNLLYYDFVSWYVRTHAGRPTMVNKDLQIKLLTAWLTRCEPPIIAMAISFGYAGESHANMVIINKPQQTIEHFDPHGGQATHLTPSENAQLGKAVQMLFRDCKFMRGYTYLSPDAVAPNFSFQEKITNEFGVSVVVERKVGIQTILNFVLEPGNIFNGTCSIWSMWYLHVRLTKPELEAQEALEQAMQVVTGGYLQKNPTGSLLRQQKVQRDNMANKENIRITLEKFIIDFTFWLVSLANLTAVPEHKFRCTLRKEYNGWPVGYSMTSSDALAFQDYPCKAQPITQTCVYANSRKIQCIDETEWCEYTNPSTIKKKGCQRSSRRKIHKS